VQGLAAGHSEFGLGVLQQHMTPNACRELDKDLAKLVTWAREQGFLKAPPLIFVVEEWHETGDCMWDTSIQGKAKETTALGAVVTNCD